MENKRSENVVTIWRELHDQCFRMVPPEAYESWMLKEAHRLYVNKKITGEDFAAIMDITMRW